MSDIYSLQITIYKEASSQPTTPTGGTCDFTITNNKIKGMTSVPSGWFLNTETLDGPIYASSKTFYSNGVYSDWTTPTRIIDKSYTKNDIETLVKTIVNNTITSINTSIANIKSFVTLELENSEVNLELLSSKNAINNYNTLMNSINTLNSLMLSLQTLSGSVTSLTNQISNNNDLISANSISIQTLDSAIKNLLESISSLLSDINNLKNN